MLLQREIQVQVAVLLQAPLEDTRIARVRLSSPLKRSSMFVDLMRLLCLRSGWADVNVS